MEGHYVTQSVLIERGWTKSLINRFLPAPLLRPNPYYKKAAPMKLWDLAVVQEAESTQNFAEEKLKADHRKQAAKKGVTTQTNNLIAKIQKLSEHIHIECLCLEQLKRETLAAKREWYSYHDHDFDDVLYVDEETLDRWIVNFIRHNLTHYDDFLRGIKGRIGAADAYPVLKRAVLTKIAEVYPEYAQECNEQKKVIW